MRRLTEEEREARALKAAEKRAAAEPRTAPPKIATTYVHTRHPDTGLEIDFIPGEALPAWAVKDAEEQAHVAVTTAHATE